MPQQTVADRLNEGAEYVLRKMYSFEDSIVREEFEVYRRALNDIYAAMNDVWNMQVSGDTWSPTDVEARNALIRQIMGRMSQLDDQAMRDIMDAMLLAHDAGLYGTAWTLDNSIRQEQVRSPVAIPLIPTEVVRAQLLAPYVGKTFVSRFEDKRVEFELGVRRALTDSQIAGDTIFQAQKRIAAELGIDISRRTKVDRLAHRRDFNRTQMIARTEILRASNLGSLAVYEANQDVLKGWEWITAMDDRVCVICAPLDGEVFNFNNERVDGGSVGDAQVPPPAHPQCRCSTLPVLIDQGLQDELAGKRRTFFEWADEQGISESRYGQVYRRPGRDAPKLGRVA